jgi:RNA polymerase sigma-70 factor (ECF subfamily)
MDGGTPDLAFDRRWAETILDQALEKLRQENVERGKEKFYETLKPCLATDTADDYASLGRELGMTPGAIAVAIHRLRLRFRELVRSAVADTVGSEADLEDEMRNFLAILSP